MNTLPTLVKTEGRVFIVKHYLTFLLWELQLLESKRCEKFISSTFNDEKIPQHEIRWTIPGGKKHDSVLRYGLDFCGCDVSQCHGNRDTTYKWSKDVLGPVTDATDGASPTVSKIIYRGSTELGQ